MPVARILQAVALSLLLLPIMATSASAAPVSIRDNYFDPKVVTVDLGENVRWENDGNDFHDTKSDRTNPDGSEGVAWWASPELTPLVGTFEWEFTAAGIFPYHDTSHEGMSGKVRVPMEVTPAVGEPDSEFRLRFATVEAPDGFVYDVQKRGPDGGRFRNWRMGMTDRTAILFSPRDLGKFSFRARLRRLSTGGASLYSQPRSILVVGNLRVVEIYSKDFHPEEVTAELGDAVLWTARAGTHTSTSFEENPDGTKGLAWWSSDPLYEDFAWQFTASGVFPYYCVYHERAMQGSVRVPVKVSPARGNVGTTFRIRVATEPAPAGYVYDIQRRAPGESFEPWKLGVTSPRVNFRPDGPGTYDFRARLRRLFDDGHSYYSLPVSVVVT